MSKFVRTGLTAGMALSAAAGWAGTAQALDVSRVELGITVDKGAACPRNATLKAWARTNGPGKVDFVIRQAGGGKSGVLSANAVKGAAGTYLATYTLTFKITADTDTKYVAEAMGHGKISPWVPVKATCGPQVRTKTTVNTGSRRGPKGRHISEIEKKEEKQTGKPVPSGQGKPIPSGQGKPAGGGKPAGTTKPVAQCKDRTITATRYSAVTKRGGIGTAWVAWSSGVKKQYGRRWSDVRNAKDKRESCTWAGTYTCTVSAQPCE